MNQLFSDWAESSTPDFGPSAGPSALWDNPWGYRERNEGCGVAASVGQGGSRPDGTPPRPPPSLRPNHVLIIKETPREYNKVAMADARREPLPIHANTQFSMHKALDYITRAFVSAARLPAAQ